MARPVNLVCRRLLILFVNDLRASPVLPMLPPLHDATFGRTLAQPRLHHVGRRVHFRAIRSSFTQLFLVHKSV